MKHLLHALSERIGYLVPPMWFRFLDVTLFGMRVQIEMTSLDLEDAIGELERLVDEESDARSAHALLEALERRAPDHPRIVRLAVMLRLLDDWVNDVRGSDDRR